MTGHDQDIINRLKSGDKSAFAELYGKYIRYAYGTAFLIVKDQSMASDICQDSFIKVYENISKFRDGLAFKPWFYRIIVNEAMRLTRRLMRLPKPTDTIPEIPSHHSVPESAALRKELQVEMKKALDKLPEKLRVVLVLRYYTELTEEEIANTLQIPPGTVKSRLNRGRERLGIVLDEQQTIRGGIHHA